MIKKTGDPNFVYKLVCDQLCGKGHFSMTANIVVETQEEFDKWISSQHSQYELAMGGGTAPAADTSHTGTPKDSVPAVKAAQ
jgi:cytochrome c oxidase subunit 2